jgi:hypothetical protein
VLEGGNENIEGEGGCIMPIRTSSRRHSSDGEMYANQRHIVKV